MDYRTLRQAIAIAKEQRQVEKWRTIPEFPNYVLSSKGRVAHKNGKEVALNGADAALLFRGDGFRTTRSVRLLMKAIWPEAPNPYAKQKKTSE